MVDTRNNVIPKVEPTQKVADRQWANDIKARIKRMSNGNEFQKELEKAKEQMNNGKINEEVGVAMRKMCGMRSNHSCVSISGET